jgi:hypothetical protein
LATVGRDRSGHAESSRSLLGGCTLAQRRFMFHR